MRKIITILVTISMLIANVTVCFAANDRSQGFRQNNSMKPYDEPADVTNQLCDETAVAGNCAVGTDYTTVKQRPLKASAMKRLWRPAKNKGILYKEVANTAVTLSINKGRASGSAVINVKSAGTITLAKATLRFVHKKTGKTKTYSGIMSNSGLKYVFRKNYKLPQKGQYYLKATIQCYNNGVLVETINKTSGIKKY